MDDPLKTEQASPEQIRQVWRQRWGLPVITTRATYRPRDVEGLALVSPAGEAAALVTWAVYGQTRRCIEVARQALEQAGGDLSHVVRTRVLLSAAGMERWQDAARAHGEVFSAVRPACTFVQVAGFIDERWLVELELDAVVRG